MHPRGGRDRFSDSHRDHSTRRGVRAGEGGDRPSWRHLRPFTGKRSPRTADVQCVEIAPVNRGHPVADEQPVFDPLGSDHDGERHVDGSAATAPDRLFDGLPASLFLDRIGFEKHVDALNDEQKGFIYDLSDWLRGPGSRVSLVTGGPGTGKTFAVKQTLEFLNLNVLSLAYTGRIAKRNNGFTIHSAFRLKYDEESVVRQLARDLASAAAVKQQREGGAPELTTRKRLEMSRVLYDALDYRFGKFPDVVFFDEASMIDQGLLFQVTKKIVEMIPKGRKVYVVYVGDPNQLPPVDSKYNVFGAVEEFEEAFGPMSVIRLAKSMRFDQRYERLIDRVREIIQKQQSAAEERTDLSEPKDENDDEEDELIQLIRQEFPVVEEVDESLLAKCRRALVFRNDTVRQYNRFYLKHFPGKRVRLPQLTEDGDRIDLEKFVDLKCNCDVFLTKNTKTLPNGTPLVFLRYDGTHDELVCKLQENQQTVRVERDRFDGQFPVVVGFAGTIHKFQGDTVDDRPVLFNFDGCRSKELIYTGLSRVRSMDQIAAVVL